MTEAISSRLGLQPAEFEKARVAFLYTALIVASLYALKPARDAQFLWRIGAGGLPYMYLVSGLAMAAAAAAIARLLKGRPIGRAVTGLTRAAIGANLAVWLVSLASPGRWFYGLFYLWVALMGLVLPLYGWLLWNELFTAREARRAFWLIVLGGPLGAFLGGLSAGLAASWLGTASLIPLAVIHLAAGLMVLRRARRLSPDLWRYYSPALLRLPSSESPLRLLGRSGHLSWILAALLVMEFISTWIDFAFQAGIQGRFSSMADMARFFGWFYASVNFLEIAAQVLLSRFLIRRWGVRWSLLILPLGLGLGSAGLGVYGLIGLVSLRGLDSLLRHTFSRTSLELLYVPLPKELKEAGRGPLEAMAQRAGMALAAWASSSSRGSCPATAHGLMPRSGWLWRSWPS